MWEKSNTGNFEGMIIFSWHFFNRCHLETGNHFSFDLSRDSTDLTISNIHSKYVDGGFHDGSCRYITDDFKSLFDLAQYGWINHFKTLNHSISGNCFHGLFLKLSNKSRNRISFSMSVNISKRCLNIRMRLPAIFLNC